MRFSSRHSHTAVLLVASVLCSIPLLAQAGGQRGFITEYGVTPVAHALPQPLVPEPVYRHLQLRNHFDFDRAKLHLNDQRQLGELADLISSLHPAFGMGRYGYLRGGQIVGNTDNVGTYSYNDVLARRRALAVQAYLQTHGLDTSDLSVYGLGKRQPIANNATAEGRARNRRTDIELQLLTLPSQGEPGWSQ